jgi:hypothetical protein
VAASSRLRLASNAPSCSLVPSESPPVVHPVLRVGVDPQPRRCPPRDLRPHLRRLPLRVVPRLRAQHRRDCIPYRGNSNVGVKVGAYFTKQLCGLILHGLSQLYADFWRLMVSTVLVFGILNASSLNLLGFSENHNNELISLCGSSRKGPKLDSIFTTRYLIL